MIDSLSEICELGVKYSIKKKKNERIQITKSKSAEEILRIWYEKTDLFEQKEIFTALFLTRNNDFIGLLKVSEGNSTSTIVDIKYLFRAAILCNASGIILCHNHPSGNVKASEVDKSITKKLMNAAEFADIQVLDHLILSPYGEYYSFADNNDL